MGSAMVPNGRPQDHESGQDRVAPAESLEYEDTVVYHFEENPDATQPIPDPRYIQGATFYPENPGYEEEPGYSGEPATSNPDVAMMLLCSWVRRGPQSMTSSSPAKRISSVASSSGRPSSAGWQEQQWRFF